MDIDEIKENLAKGIEAIEQLRKLEEENKTQSKGKTKKEEETIVKKEATLPYSATTEILENMSITENKKRFGILTNADNPYSINNKAIENFYNDYGIKCFRVWYMSYANKDIIINKQLKNATKKEKEQSRKNRIKKLEGNLKKVKSKNHKNPNHKEKMENAIINNIERLEKMRI